MMWECEVPSITPWGPATTSQTAAPAVYGQMGRHGMGHGMMMGVAYGQNGHQAPRHGQTSAQYHGSQGHGGPCW